MKKTIQGVLGIALALTISDIAEGNMCAKRFDYYIPDYGKGWSFDVGGTYTWMAFTTPPTYSGSTGGVQGKITYQNPWDVFGQVRTYYNLGPLSSSLNNTRLYEWYLEVVGGYDFPLYKGWSVTPYAGLGFDFLYDDHSAYSTIASIQLRYSIYYAIVGIDAHYTWCNWMAGLQVDCLPTFNQYLRIKALPGEAWTLTNKTGAAVRAPVAFRYFRDFWVEVAPYYRFFPVGPSSILGLSNRNLNQWGFYLTFRFFL